MSTNFKPIMQIVTWFLLITCSLAIIARGVTKAAVVRSTSLDINFISVSWARSSFASSIDASLLNIGLALCHYSISNSHITDIAWLWEAVSFCKANRNGGGTEG